jgi:hypothetical protein
LMHRVRLEGGNGSRTAVSITESTRLDPKLAV